MKLKLGGIGVLTLLSCGCAPDPATSPAANDAPIAEADTTPPQAIFESDEQLVADAVLRCILTSPEIQVVLDDYGTPGSKKLCLRGSGARWPSDEYRATAGYEVHFGRWREMEAANEERVLGLDLESLTVKKTDEWPFATAEARVTIQNAGGTKNGGIIGGCNASFKVTKTDEGWVAEIVELFDP